MKKIIILLFLSFFILAGVGCEKKSTEEFLEENKTGLANPASVYCEEQGGNLDMRSNEAGQYGVCVFSDGSECEEWAYFRGECLPARASQWQAGVPAENFSEQELAKEIAELKFIVEKWIKEKSSTYFFDGFELKFLKTKKLDCLECYEHTFSFKSQQAGYGDRTGQILAQMITYHEIIVETKNKKVVSAITDGRYDEIKNEMLEVTKEVRPIKVSLIPQNESKQTGIATLVETLGKVKIIIDLINYSNEFQPAYIQAGNCGDLGVVKYTLESVAEGSSETLLDTSLDNLLGQLPLVINIKKDLKTAALCGEIGER